MSDLATKLRETADALEARDKPFLPADDMSLLAARQMLLETGVDTQIGMNVNNYPHNASRQRGDGDVRWQVYICERSSDAFFTSISLRGAVQMALASIEAERAAPPADPLAAAQAALEPATVAAAPGF